MNTEVTRGWKGESYVLRRTEASGKPSSVSWSPELQLVVKRKNSVALDYFLFCFSDCFRKRDSPDVRGVHTPGKFSKKALSLEKRTTPPQVG